MWDKAKGVGRMFVDAGALHECEMRALVTPDHIAVQVRSSRQGRVGIGRSSWKGLSTGRHDKDSTPRCSTDASVLTVQVYLLYYILFNVDGRTVPST